MIKRGEVGSITSRRGEAKSDGDYIIEGDREALQIRRLTPTECERLQGFPDGWTTGSDTQRYKQLGNAVTVNVIEAIMRRMINNG
jgi:site-specific DNA-cytosine methylase